MASYRILHIYSDILDLYGDYANITMVAQCLHRLGHDCSIDTLQLNDPIDTTGYDLVYMGHGKARNLAAVAPHFYQYGDHIRSQIEAGQVFFVTGNARLLFGETFELYNGEITDGIGLFHYHGRETGRVFTSDVVAHPSFDPGITTYGFINRTAHIVGESEYPLFHLLRGHGDNDRNTAVEGNLYKNYLGTWQMGPLLVRNPALLRDLLHRIMGSEPAELDLSLQEEALARTLREFGSLEK